MLCVNTQGNYTLVANDDDDDGAESEKERRNLATALSKVRRRSQSFFDKSGPSKVGNDAVDDEGTSLDADDEEPANSRR